MPKVVEYPGAGTGKAEGEDRITSKNPKILSFANNIISAKVTFYGRSSSKK
jgi:hypothetical protein